jgi:hypothetical protein
VRPLAPSRVDACNPLLQAHPTWARDKHEGRGFHLSRLSPSGFFPPSRSVSRRPIWAGARRLEDLPGSQIGQAMTPLAEEERKVRVGTYNGGAETKTF